MPPAVETLSVALVSPGWPPSAVPNGIVSYVATMVPALEAIGVKSFVITPSVKADHRDAFVHHLPQNGAGRGWIARKAAAVMRRLRPDSWPARSFAADLLSETRRLQPSVIEMEESFGWAKYLRDCPAPVILRLHGPWFLNGAANGAVADARFARRNRDERDGLLAARGVTSPSAQVLEATRVYFGLELKNAEVIPNPVAPPPPEAMWSADACRKDSILFVGRFDRHKGADLAIDAFAKVHASRPNATLRFVGPDRGLKDDSGREWKIQDFLAARLNDAARANVEVMGFQPQATITAMRKQFAVTIAPSRYEVFGIATTEAMACGCPVVAGEVGGLAEIVQHERNGLLCRPGDAADLAEKIVRLFDDPLLATRLSEQAKQDCTERYHPDVIARRTKAYYQRVLAS